MTAIDIYQSIADLILSLEDSIESYEEAPKPLVLTKPSAPSQKDWEEAASNLDIPFSERVEFYWKSGDKIRGQYGLALDRAFCLFPARSVVLGDTTHFEFERFIFWESIGGIHIIFSGSLLTDTGLRTGLFRAYRDGTIEPITISGFTPDLILGGSTNGQIVWYVEGNSLKRLAFLTSTITTVTTGLIVAPEEVVVDSALDAFFLMDIGAGLRIYRWNNTGATLVSLKTSITVNGISEAPGRPVAAGTSYVVVETSEDNYWVQFNRTSLVETRIKSNPDGATAANLPVPSADSWTQRIGQNFGDRFAVIYTEVSGASSPSEWQRSFTWDMATSTYTEEAQLPSLLDHFLDICIHNAPEPDPLLYRRQLNPFMKTTAYRTQVGNSWVYNNIIKTHSVLAGTPMLVELTDGQIMFLSTGVSGKVWRISEWDQGDSDSLLIVDTPFTNGPLEFLVDLRDVPPEYGLIEVTLSSAVKAPSTAVMEAGLRGADFGANNLIPGLKIIVDPNTYAAGNVAQLPFHYAENSLQGSILKFAFLKDFLIGDKMHLHLVDSATNTGLVNRQTEYHFGVRYLPTMPDQFVIPFLDSAGQTGTVGGYLIVRALRTHGRRQGGAYYVPAMA